MKYLYWLLLLLPACPVLATWGTAETPTYTFDNAGNILAASDCATDSADGRICVTITQDSTGAALTLDGTGNLKNQANITTALTNALNTARTSISAAIAKKITDATNMGKINVPPPSISGT